MSVSRFVRLARADPAWFAQRVREEAEQRGAQLGRRARLGARGAMRTAVDRSGVARMAVTGPVADARYFAVLDSCTLNLHASLPADWAAAAELVLSKQGTELRAPAQISGGLVTATVLLGRELGGLPISPGRWRVSVVPAGDLDRAIRLRVPQGHRTPGVDDLTPGPTGLTPGSPVTGLRISAEASPAGLGRLVVARVAACAEVTGVRMAYDEVEISGLLVGVEPVGAMTVRFQAAGGVRATHRVPATLDGGTFRCTAPLARLGASHEERSWTIYAELAGRPALRIGRYLHDLKEPRTVLRLPQRAVMPEPGMLVRVRPYYTGTGALTLACAHVKTFSGAGK